MSLMCILIEYLKQTKQPSNAGRKDVGTNLSVRFYWIHFQWLLCTRGKNIETQRDYSVHLTYQLYVTKLFYSAWWQIFWNVVSSHILWNYEKFIKFALFTVGIVVVVVFENHNKFISKFYNEVLGARTFPCCDGFLMGMSALEENARWLCQTNRTFRRRTAFPGLEITPNHRHPKLTTRSIYYLVREFNCQKS